MSEREQFEARAAEKLRLPVEVIQSARNGDRYLHAFDSMNVMQPLNGWWDWWQASREALKAEQTPDDGFMCVPVADLYELQLKSGSPYCYTPSSSEAHGWAKEGYPIREYVLLDRLQDAMNHPIDTTPNQYDALGKGGEQ